MKDNLNHEQPHLSADTEKSTYQYYNRDLSWLSFNYRVLEEAKDKELPLYERIKFLAIYSNNLDEFYRVRVAYYQSLLHVAKTRKDSLKYDPEQIIMRINEEVNRQQEEFVEIFAIDILPELAEHNIILYNDLKLLDAHREYISQFFHQEILPFIQPVLIEVGSIISFLQDNVIYLAIKLFRKSRKTNVIKKKSPRYALIKMPTNHLPRFIEMPKTDENHYISFLDDILKYNLNIIFPGFHIDSCYSIILSRDADIVIDDEFHGNVAEYIKKGLSKRKTGAPAKFTYDRRMPMDFLRVLIKLFNLSHEELIPGPAYHHFADFFKFPNPLAPRLQLEEIQPMEHSGIAQYLSMISAMKARDWMLHFPYHSFQYVLRLLQEAAVDPKVVEIKATQYRVATNSAFVNALIGAARNGKKVTVFVEFQARFDEENNLQIANLMNKAGIKVIPSIPGLKVHSKVVLILRKSSKEKNLKGYTFISTGNFNEKTAKIYSDHGYLTANQDIANECNLLFNVFEDRTFTYNFKHILVAGFNLKSTLKLLIDREIKNVSEGKKGHIVLKVNGLEEPMMMDKLYEASEKGVKIDIINRGVCSLIPNQSFSNNIKIVRIVDRYLEHARVYWFHNDGANDIFISSADWMKRNLNRRIELAVKIEQQDLKQELMDILNLQLSDTVKASLLDENHQNIRVQPHGNEAAVRSQIETYNYLKSKIYPNKSDVLEN